MKRLDPALAALAVTFALVAMHGKASAAAQLFKCVDGGHTIYQQQACPVSAQAEPAASAVHPIVNKAKADAAVAPATAAPPHKLRPASPPASGAPATPR